MKTIDIYAAALRIEEENRWMEAELFHKWKTESGFSWTQELSFSPRFSYEW